MSERAKDDVSSRVMYDDVNESFWSRATVHALLPHGCGHVPMPEREISCEPLTTSPYCIPLLHPLTTSPYYQPDLVRAAYYTPSLRLCPIRCEPLATRRAYAYLRRKLGEVPEKPARPLAQYLRKTYREMNGWLHLFQMFYRVYVFHAVLLHLTFAVAYAGWDWCAAEAPQRHPPPSGPTPRP